MVKHIVLFKLKNKADIPQAVDALKALKGKIDGLLDIEVGTDFLHSERSFDIALTCTLKDRAALDFYQDHPLHVPVKEMLGAMKEASVACDYYID